MPMPDRIDYRGGIDIIPLGTKEMNLCPDCMEAGVQGAGKCPHCGRVLFDESLLKTGYHPSGASPLLFGRFDASPVKKRGPSYESYRGVDCASGNSVFIKRAVKGESGVSPEFDQLVHEAEAAAGFDHPRVARLLDVRRDEAEIILVFELAPGRDLLEISRQNGPLSSEEVRSIGIMAVEGLDYLLSRGIIHNDIKPANIVWDGGKGLKIVDSGLAARMLFGEAGTDLRGTLPYMSPERALEGRIGIASEIYGLGATLYHLAAGHPPFWTGDVKSQILEKAPAPIRDERGSFPAALDETILRCLHKNPKKRWADYKDFAFALEHSSPEKELAPGAAPALNESATIARLLSAITRARIHLVEAGDKSAARIVKDLEDRLLDWKLSAESRPGAANYIVPGGAELIGQAETLLADVLEGRKAKIDTRTAEFARLIDKIKSRS